jgi:hypothetical protein
VGFGNAHLYRRLEYDKDGKGFWHVNYRENHTELPSMVHFKYNSTTKRYDVNFAEYYAGRASGAIRYDINQERLAVAGGKPTVRNRTWTDVSYDDAHLTMHPWPTNVSGTYPQKAVQENWITIYTINPDTLQAQLITNFTDRTKISFKRTLEARRKNLLVDSVYVNIGFGAHDIAWDYADNLYVAGRGDHQFCAFALPHKNKVVSTPCKQDYYFDSDTYLLTITIAPANTGTVVDNDFGKEFRYYMKDAKFQLLAIPETGYRFYCWDEYDIPYPQTIGATLTSEHTMTGNYNRTAHFGIDVWETKAITQTDKTMTFRGVFVQRELDTVSYSTICLPFHLESLEGTPYQGASVLEFTEAVPSDVEGDNRISLNFTEVEFGTGKGMRAGVPYLIKLETAIASGEEKIFNNVTCPPIGTQGQSVIQGAVTFHGLLNPTTFTKAEIQDKLFLTADNRLVSLYGKDKFTINGLRGYFTVSGVAQNAEFVLNLPKKVVTSTPMVNIADTLQVTKYLWNGQIYIQRGNEVYDLSGVRVK